MTITLPLSTVKKLLTSEGEFRADPESIKKFHDVCIAKCKELAVEFQSKASADNRKTIQGTKDFD